jgi:hypothetical protein
MSPLDVTGSDRDRPDVGLFTGENLELAALAGPGNPTGEAVGAPEVMHGVDRERPLRRSSRRDDCRGRISRRRLAELPAFREFEHFPQKAVDGVGIRRDDLDVIDAVHRFPRGLRVLQARAAV